MDDLDVDRIHVQAPKKVVFLCGGPFSDLKSPIPLSLRDAFLKATNNSVLSNYDFIQAEDITSFFLTFGRTYKNILDFETDLAEIAELILLFCESEGSCAELGSFVMVREISERLLVVTRSKHWTNNSFIRLGPLQALEERHGATSVYVVNDKEINMSGDSTAQVHKEVLVAKLDGPIKARLASTRSPSTFNKDRPGHIIKLIVGLIQDYGALTYEEIIEALFHFRLDSISNAQISKALLCADAVKWVKADRRGAVEYFVASTPGYAATFQTKESAEIRDRSRRRTLIRELWKDTDVDRFNSISEQAGTAHDA